jgi:hypothetical protein
MQREPICEFRTARQGLTALCGLGLYGGKVTIGVCNVCIAKNQNNAEYAKELFAKAERSHPSTAKRVSGCCDSARNYIDR